MSKIYSSLKPAIFAIFLFFSSISFSQTTISTQVGSTNYTAANGLSGNSGITFVVENTSGGPINITQVATFLEIASNGTVPKLWYSASSLSGATPPVTPPDWTLITTGTSLTITTTGLTDLFTGLSFQMPNNTQYRFAIESSINIRYSGATPVPTPNLFTSGGVTLKSGAEQIAALNIGYSITYPAGTMSNNPRWFTGSITFEPASPCVAPPTGGTTVSNQNAVCPGFNFNLSLIGQSVGTGQTFQWQSSPDNVVWTDILGATNSTLTTSHFSPTYYRSRLSCSGQNAFSASTFVGILPILTTGNYTINQSLPTSGTNYNSFTDALAGLACGISGTVVFDVDSASGPYFGPFNFGSIAGADAANTITFNGNGSVLTRNTASSTSNRHVVRLDGTDYLTFSDFTISIPDTTLFGWGIHVLNNANFNTISGNRIINNLTATNTNHAGIVVSGSATSATTGTIANSNIIENNEISGGYYGITLLGTTGVTGVGQNIIRNNIVKDYYFFGIYLANTDSTIVELNDIFRGGRVNVSTFYGVYGITANNNLLVQKNRIHDSHTGASSNTSLAAGIFFTSSDAAIGEPNIIANNIIYNINNSGISYGLYNASSDNCSYFYNTISINNPTATAGDARGFFQTTAANGIIIRNNIFRVNKGGSGLKHALYFNTSTSAIVSDNNVLFSTSTGTGLAYIGNLGGLTNHFLTLADWQLAGSGLFDLASLNANPQFSSPVSGNFIPTASSINNIGAPIPEILEDFLGAARDINTPDPGAYEFSPASTDAGITFINEPIAPCTGPADVKVTLKNFGIDPITSVTINWSVNNVAQTAFNLLGTLASSEDTILSIGSFNVVANVLYSIKVWSSNPNGNVDSNPANDTIIKSGIRSALTGTYTIGGVGSNYSTIVNAAADLNAFGVCGPVVFNINAAAGPYNQRVQLDEILGTSAINTITFNGNGALIQYLPLLTDNRAAFQLRGSDYVIIDNINIIVDSTGFGFGLHLTQGADNNILRNSTITLDQKATTTGIAGIVLSGSNTSATTAGSASNNSFLNNIVNGGYYGAAISGATGALDAKNNLFDNNKFNNFHFHGIYMSNNDSTQVSNNEFSRLTRSIVGTFNGVFVTIAANNLRIFNNEIHDSHTGILTSITPSNGINFLSADAVVGKENRIYNNLIYKLNSSGITNGIINTGADNALYYFNTIALESDGFTTAGDVRGFFQTTAASGIEFRNNIVSITKGGTGAKQALFFNTATSTIISNNNGLFVNSPSSSVQAIGNIATVNFPTLADWQSANGGIYDLASNSSNPQFANIVTNNFIPSSSGFNDIALPITGISTDFNGVIRNTTNPDPGVFEFTPAALDAGLSNFVQPKFPCAGTNAVEVSFTNFGLTLITTATINWTLNGVAQTSFSYTGNLNSGQSDTISLGSFQIVGNNSYDLTAFTSSPNGTTDANVANDTVKLNGLKASLNGTFTIGGLGSDYATISLAASDLNTRGVCGPVIFNVNNAASPYEEQVALGIINGANATNTIIFNGNGSTITFAPTNTLSRHILLLNGTDYTTFDNFNIEVSDIALFGWGVHLTNGADYNKITNSRIKTSTVSTAFSDYTGILSSGSANSTSLATVANFNEFSNNEIIGGYQGIRLNGSTGSVGHINNIITRNTISDSYLYGIYLSNTDSTFVSENNISRPSRTTLTTFNGIYLVSGAINSTISKNKIHDPFTTNPFSTSAAYGIYFSFVDAPLGKENKVFNNLIYNFSGNGLQGGIYNLSSDGVWIAHNTISLDDTNATAGITYGIYQSTLATNLEVRNNIVSVTRSGSGSKTGLFYNTNTSIFTSSNNIINVDTADVIGTQFYGRWGAINYVTLADFQAATSLEAGSLEANPLLTNNNIQVPQIGSPAVGAGIPIPYVEDDFIGDPRSLSNPTLGAFEQAKEALPPAILFSDLVNTFITTNRVLSNFATITDASGVDTTLITRPRLYYKKSTDNNAFVGNTSSNNGWKFVLASTTSPTFDFTINYSLLNGGGVTVGDVVQYFVAAQDLNPIPNVGIFSGNLSGNPLSVDLLANNFPVTGSIKSYTILPTPPSNDLAVVEIISPDLNQCGSNQDSVVFVISNLGLSAQSNFSVNVILSGAISDTLTTIYTASLAGQASDTISLGIINTNISGVVNVNAFVVLVGDANVSNDTLSVSVTYSISPNAPLVTGDTICPNQTATLIADAGSSTVKWYTSLLGTTSIFTGDTLIVPSLTLPTTYYAEATTISNFAPAIKITELDLGGTDQIEIQNLSTGTANTAGWKVIISDSYTDINTINAFSWNLPTTMNPGEILTRTDASAAPNYWGSNIFWNPGAFPSFAGWAIVLDNNNVVQDAVFMNWPAASIASSAITFNGNPVVIGTQWTGDGFNITNVLATDGVLRIGTSDNNLLTDFTIAPLSIGTINTNLSPAFSGVGCTSPRVAVQVSVNTAPVVNLGANQTLCIGDSITLDASNFGGTYLWSTGATSQTIMVKAGGTYSVVVTNTNGCSGSDFIVITNGIQPIVNLGSDAGFCSGSNLVLNAGNLGGIFLWSTGATTQTITVNSAGTYFVIVTNADGCSSSDTIIVSEFLAADASFTSAQNPLSRALTFIPTIVTGTHNWNFGDGIGSSTLANPVYSYTTNGKYLVSHIQISTDGCSDTTSDSIMVNTPVGINEQFFSAFSYQVYPNPMQNETRILYELKERSAVQVNVFDLLGRKIVEAVNTTQNIGKHEFTINKEMFNAGSGIYQIQLMVNGKSETIRLVKAE